jgi:head-tail adaptor
MSTGYSAGMRKDRIKILNRKKAQTSDFGIDGNGIEWEESECLWVDVSWTKGMRAQNAGAIHVYGIIAVRMNYDAGMCRGISMRSRVRDSEGITYQILPETYHPDRQENTIEFRAQAIINE